MFKKILFFVLLLVFCFVAFVTCSSADAGNIYEDATYIPSVLTGISFFGSSVSQTGEFFVPCSSLWSLENRVDFPSTPLNYTVSTLVNDNSFLVSNRVGTNNGRNITSVTPLFDYNYGTCEFIFNEFGGELASTFFVDAKYFYAGERINTVYDGAFDLVLRYQKLSLNDNNDYIIENITRTVRCYLTSKSQSSAYYPFTNSSCVYNDVLYSFTDINQLASLIVSDIAFSSGQQLQLISVPTVSNLSILADCFTNSATLTECLNAVVLNQSGYSYSSIGQSLPTQPVVEEVDVNVFHWLFDAVQGVLDITIFGSLTLGHLILVVIALPLLIAILKMIAGG